MFMILVDFRILKFANYIILRKISIQQDIHVLFLSNTFSKEGLF